MVTQYGVLFKVTKMRLLKLLTGCACTNSQRANC